MNNPKNPKRSRSDKNLPFHAISLEKDEIQALLMTAALQMRRNNSCLLSQSTRSVFSCFDELEVCRFTDNNSDCVWAEKYYYANIDPLDSDGKVICRFVEPPDQHTLSNPVVMIRCHECSQRFESFDFSFHISSHVELNRHENEREEYKKRNLVECKHCFKTYTREQLLMHKTLLRSHLHMVKYGCRICCILLKGRSEFLKHMRNLHFEHETPYRCPSCKFASSFQRDVYIHFQEEHRHSMIILCPICLKGFTVKYPEKMTEQTMAELSKIIYNHIAEHYAISKSLTCDNCCLCFLTKHELKRHRLLHHDPCEVRPADVRKDEFVVTKEEEEHCVKAIQMELFIANKRPNVPFYDDSESIEDYKRKVIREGKKMLKKKRMMNRKGKQAICDDKTSESESDSDSEDTEEEESSSIESNDDDSSSKASGGDKNTKPPQTNHNHNCSGSSVSDNDLESSNEEEFCDDSFITGSDSGTVFVRSDPDAKKFLKNGCCDLKVTSYKVHSKKSLASSSSCLKGVIPAYMNDTCSSHKLIAYLSRMKQADGINPNQSAILTPQGRPAKCCECFQFVTSDHFVASINCRYCKYMTQCPRAAIVHKETRHISANLDQHQQ